ncbi:hypothetical protein [Asaia lannensis]|uniref:hypothetical protein n=1 Tax=Asaia lannensis TaxID=415421 RepID=UPI001C9970D7
MSLFQNILQHLPTLSAMMREEGIDECTLPIGTGNLTLVLKGNSLPRRAIPSADTQISQRRGDDTPVNVLSPEMGILSELRVSDGDKVSCDTILGFIASGPLRLMIRSPIAGIVSQCQVNPGDVVGFHQLLLFVTPGH